MGVYDIDIEIDADWGDIAWTKNGEQYFYTVEELEGKGILQNILGAADITVYSQNERMTIEEYLQKKQDGEI